MFRGDFGDLCNGVSWIAGLEEISMHQLERGNPGFLEEGGCDLTGRQTLLPAPEMLRSV